MTQLKVDSKIENKSDIKTKKKFTFDVNKIVEKTRALYGKKEKGFAEQIVTTGTEVAIKDKDSNFVVWSTGDHWKQLTHLKGLPYGRICQISGKPDSGKSSHAMLFMKEAQDQGVAVILWDAEKKFSVARYDNKMGGDSSNLLRVNTNNIIDGAKAVANFVKAIKEEDPNQKILIVWDSVGASINSTEDNEDDEDFSKQPGVTAKEIAWAIRKFNKLLNSYINKETGEETIAVLVVNQTYANIGSVGQTEKGGGELYYLSSVIIQLSRKQDLTRVKQGEKYKYGIVTRAKVKKNHLFDGNECISEMDLVVSADGIALAKEVKKNADIKGWDETEENSDD